MRPDERSWLRYLLSTCLEESGTEDHTDEPPRLVVESVCLVSGTWFRRYWVSASAGFTELASAVVAYYIFGLTLGDRTDVGLGAVGPTLLR